ncbi:MAG: type II toxin-antitoxin system HicA family toxin [Candidatus Manganitrophus sp.]|nr:MAG: type II toxin-antitoxin system HicA family toxin [Candidatus Manganitrophus sp.]
MLKIFNLPHDIAYDIITKSENNMPSKEDLLKGIKCRPHSVHRSELVSLLERFGFILRKKGMGGSGSHDVFKNPKFPELRALPIPRHNQVKYYIVKQVIEYLEYVLDEEARRERD